jgi:hypothetical protein
LGEDTLPGSREEREVKRYTRLRATKVGLWRPHRSDLIAGTRRLSQCNGYSPVLASATYLSTGVVWHLNRDAAVYSFRDSWALLTHG